MRFPLKKKRNDWKFTEKCENAAKIIKNPEEFRNFYYYENSVDSLETNLKIWA